MAVMSVTGTWPPPGQAFTVADLDRMPDNGRRYELVDGVLLVGPRPMMGHQLVVFELAAYSTRLARRTWLPDQSPPCRSPQTPSSTRTSSWSVTNSSALRRSPSRRCSSRKSSRRARR